MASAQEIDVSQMSFEAALARLEEIVRTLEKGEAPLDQSITLYQEGDKLRRHCEARLKDAQARIEQIAFGSDGKPAGLKPFGHDNYDPGRRFYFLDPNGIEYEVVSYR